jgi:hypothetical protein
MKEGQRFQLTEASTSITDEEYTLHISDKLELSGVVLYYVLNHHLFSIASFERR